MQITSHRLYRGTGHDFLRWVAEKKYRFVFEYSDPWLRENFASALKLGLVEWYRGSKTEFTLSERGRRELDGLARSDP